MGFHRPYPRRPYPPDRGGHTFPVVSDALSAIAGVLVCCIFLMFLWLAMSVARF